MRIDNPPSPPFRKVGTTRNREGDACLPVGREEFETYF
jgi:hypothetical protein